MDLITIECDGGVDTFVKKEDFCIHDQWERYKEFAYKLDQASKALFRENQPSWGARKLPINIVGARVSHNGFILHLLQCELIAYAEKEETYHMDDFKITEKRKQND